MSKNSSIRKKIQLSISMQFKFKYGLIVKNISISNYSFTQFILE